MKTFQLHGTNVKSQRKIITTFLYQVQFDILQDIPTALPIAPENKTYSESTTDARRSTCIIIQSPHSRQ